MRHFHRWRIHRRLLMEMPEQRATYLSYISERCEKCGEVSPWRSGLWPQDEPVDMERTDVLEVPR